MSSTTTPARAAYASLAPFYDASTHPAYGDWVRGLAALGAEHGGSGGRVLDVACGTGRSLAPLVEAGLGVTGCDAVPEMLEVAASTLGSSVELVEADMTRLPLLGSFDLVLCLNDPVNCVLSAAALRDAFAGIAANLRDGGVLVFDATTLGGFRAAFGAGVVSERFGDGLRFAWRPTTPRIAPGGRGTALLDVLPQDGGAPLARSVHVQRHHPHDVIAGALADAGLELVRRLGQDVDGVRFDHVDEDVHQKAVYVARRRASSSQNTRGGVVRAQGQDDRRQAPAGAVVHQDRVTQGSLAGIRGRLPRRPRMKATLDIRRVASGGLVVLRGDAGRDDLQLEGDADVIASLLAALDGSRSVSDVARSLGRPRSEVEAAVAELLDVGLVEDADDDALLPAARRERFDRQLGFFADMVQWPASGPAVQAALASKTVCLLGAGGLGSWAAWALACCGVGRLVVVDGDRLELSNLNRQVLYRESDLGAWKAEAAAAALRAFDGALEVDAVVQRLESADDVACAVADADLVLDGADWPAHRIGRWIDEGCRLVGVPHLGMSQQPPFIRMGPLFAPGVTGCHACQEASWREAYPLYDELADAAGEIPSAGAFGPSCGVVGTLAAHEAVGWLTGLWEPATLGTSVVVDLRTLEVTREAVPRRADCACGAA